MKKFLSLVLTLALTLSLVVLPARADNVPVTGVTLNKTSVTLYVGDTETLTATVKPDDATDDSVTWTTSKEGVATVDNTGKVTAVAKGTATITVTTTDGEKKATCSVTVKDKYEITLDKTSVTLYYNGTEANKSYTVRPTLTEKGQKVSEPTFSYSSSKEAVATVDNSGKVTLAEGAKAGDTATITVSASSYTPEPAAKTVTVSVEDRYEAKLASGAEAVTVTIGNSKTLTAPTLYDNDQNETVSGIGNSDITYTITQNTGAKISMTGHTVKALKAGTAKVEASISYGGKSYPIEYTITVEKAKLAVKLSEVTNGDKDYWDDDDLEDAVLEALEDAVSSYDTDGSEVTSVKVSANNIAGGKLYDDDDKAVTPTVNLMDESDFTFEATAGFIGNAVFNITAKIDGEDYDGTLTIPVVAEDDDIDATASGEEYSSTQISFELPDDYDYWFIYTGSASFKNEMYEGSWKKTGTEPTNWDRYADGATCKVNAKYEDGDVKLYVVGLDEDGVASTGKLTVTVDGYDIEYSGATGETITFDQDDFDDLLDEVADDRNQDGSKAKVEFTNVTFTVPTEKSEGILYNGSSKITSKSTKCTDLDKVTFAIADKAKKEVVIKFTMNYDYYKDSSKSSKTAESVSGRVVVSVVNEDIKYSVPVGGNVVFDASDFKDFFTDEYRTGTLDYVTFGKLSGSNLTDGILYATYSQIGYGTIAKTNDKFYYDSNKAADLDLDDVTFVSSTFAKAGNKIYLPFTAYGTKSSQKVEGCVAITLTAARTMNFTDVTADQWFYNNVKNAYTMGLIEGKTATTFNPNDNMTWAEAVTLAARMNQLYYNGKVTLSNSTSGNWYSSYESYAISNGIISTYLGTKANTNISRKDYVDIFYNALPYSAYTARNSVTKIPDLANDSTNAKIYTFYKAGILTGYTNTAGKANGAFGPTDNIKRSEVATILIRMMDASTRVYFTL